MVAPLEYLISLRAPSPNVLPNPTARTLPHIEPHAHALPHIEPHTHTRLASRRATHTYLASHRATHTPCLTESHTHTRLASHRATYTHALPDTEAPLEYLTDEAMAILRPLVLDVADGTLAEFFELLVLALARTPAKSASLVTSSFSPPLAPLLRARSSHWTCVGFRLP